MVYKNNIVVVVKVDGKILRESGEFVTLPFGTEYSLLFKNLDSRRAVISVEIDGKDVLDGSQLILYGNTTHELEGFLKGNKVSNRFKFIEKTKNISKYRGDRIDDGFIRVKATFEEELKYNYDFYYPPGVRGFGKSGEWSYTAAFQTNNFQTTCYHNSADTDNSKIKSEYSVVCDSLNEQDEGITVKGNDDSQQTFIEGYIGVLEKTSSIIIIRLRGMTKKSPIIFTSSKRKCETCGKIHKSNKKFCSECGTCLI